ncbi:related to Prk1p, and serine/threonine protein kinase homolog from A. thaliana [Cephalotrichum gorgonifer]|uniref:non-specific serine/threonine protein kinase n=1 Tax=Cephalotrichum gorgonifer TaxID=2041049 RepID=A0AAE8MPP3_9PEZI|nr:related to Prk1p, and serine/threonine protein kinase homolog from A. thaliana [Cephalotrichum gorgonifer]
MAQMIQDLFYSLGNCLNCFPGSPTLKINGRSFKILRLLGEGGFSYVYLVEDTATSETLALKKIRCPFGAESLATAMREVEAYRIFAHTPGIIHMVDYSVAADSGGGVGGIGGDGDGGSKTVYVLLPYYKRGNLQDVINANVVNSARFPERKLMELFLGVCKALRRMHVYEAGPARMERMEMGDGDTAGGRRVASTRAAVPDVEEETEQERPLMQGENNVAGAHIKAYAHRDIKPGNIMINDTGEGPILMDLGSVVPSPTPITSHSLAIATQDQAAEHSTMPYRAPELFDVRTGTVIDTKVDIWSMGCTLFACLIGKSPFEMRSDETGGTLSLCVLGGDWRFPDEAPGGGAVRDKPRRTGTGTTAPEARAPEVRISDPVRAVVRKCLAVEPSERPDIDELIEMVKGVIEGLPEDEA